MKDFGYRDKLNTLFALSGEMVGLAAGLSTDWNRPECAACPAVKMAYGGSGSNCLQELSRVYLNASFEQAVDDRGLREIHDRIMAKCRDPDTQPSTLQRYGEAARTIRAAGLIMGRFKCPIRDYVEERIAQLRLKLPLDSMNTTADVEIDAGIIPPFSVPL